MTSHVICIDRGQRVVYPGWVVKAINPELEATGPTEYVLDSLENWRGINQRTGTDIYDFMLNTVALKNCLGLADLLAIQKLGPTVFWQHFSKQRVYGWKAVVQDCNYHRRVPCLLISGGEVDMHWYWLGLNMDRYDIALRF